MILPNPDLVLCVAAMFLEGCRLTGAIVNAHWKKEQKEIKN